MTNICNRAEKTPTGAAGERRRRPRAEVRWPVVLFQLNGGAVVESTTRDLSSDGFYCLSPVAFGIAEQLTCILTVPAHDPHHERRELLLHCKVSVVRVDYNDAGIVGIGCRIDDFELPEDGNGRCGMNVSYPDPDGEVPDGDQGLNRGSGSKGAV